MAYLNYGTGGQTHLNGITLNGNQNNCRIIRNSIVAGLTDINGHTIVDTDCISFFQSTIFTPYYPAPGPTRTAPSATRSSATTWAARGTASTSATTPGGDGLSHLNMVAENNLVTASTWPVGVTTDGASGTGGGWNGPVTNEPTWDAVSGSQVGNLGTRESANLWADVAREVRHAPGGGSSFIVVAASRRARAG